MILMNILNIYIYIDNKIYNYKYTYELILFDNENEDFNIEEYK
jgi:hypothetical protein